MVNDVALVNNFRDTHSYYYDKCKKRKPKQHTPEDARKVFGFSNLKAVEMIELLKKNNVSEEELIIAVDRFKSQVWFYSYILENREDYPESIMDDLDDFITDWAKELMRHNVTEQVVVIWGA